MSEAFDRRRYLSDFDVSRVGHLFTDVLVVGMGLGGARAAIEAASYGKAMVVSKGGAYLLDRSGRRSFGANHWGFIIAATRRRWRQGSSPRIW